MQQDEKILKIKEIVFGKGSAQEKIEEIKPLLSEQIEPFGCDGCRFYKSCGTRMDFGNGGCNEYEK